MDRVYQLWVLLDHNIYGDGGCLRGHNKDTGKVVAHTEGELGGVARAAGCEPLRGPTPLPHPLHQLLQPVLVRLFECADQLKGPHPRH